MSARRELKKVLRRAQALGCDVTLRRSGHYCIKSPDKRVPLIFCASTPSDRRAVLNIVAELRKNGIDV